MGCIFQICKDVRWHAFWSVGGNWVISNESFLKGSSVVNYLKLMASYGQVGNDALKRLLSIPDII